MRTTGAAAEGRSFTDGKALHPLVYETSGHQDGALDRVGRGDLGGLLLGGGGIRLLLCNDNFGRLLHVGKLFDESRSGCRRRCHRCRSQANADGSRRHSFADPWEARADELFYEAPNVSRHVEIPIPNREPNITGMNGECKPAFDPHTYLILRDGVCRSFGTTRRYT
jgi:hypothetical protein